jgi:hypothetical protein
MLLHDAALAWLHLLFASLMARGLPVNRKKSRRC